MSYLVSTLKDDITRKGHGTTSDDLRDVNGLINEAARELKKDINPPETQRISELPNALYDDVFRTTAPSDLKGNEIIDIRPQVSRTETDNFTFRTQTPFDLRKAIANNEIALEYDDGIKYIRINKTLNQGILLNECEGLTQNGTWAASGLATNLAKESVYYVSGGSSLSFDVGNGSNILTNSTMSAIDLTNHEKQSSIFVWVYIPSGFTPSNLTSVALRWGSSASAYYSTSITRNFDSTAFQTGWNLLQFSWNGLTATGSPTITAFNYLQLTLTTTATGTNFKVDSFYSRLPSIYEIVYYSTCLFVTSGGTWSETVTADTDTINVNADSYQLLLEKCNQLAAENRGGKDARSDAQSAKEKYDANVKLFNDNYPQEVLPTTTTYYRFRKG